MHGIRVRTNARVMPRLLEAFEPRFGLVRTVSDLDRATEAMCGTGIWLGLGVCPLIRVAITVHGKGGSPQVHAAVEGMR